MFTVPITGCNFQYEPKFWCFHGSILSTVMLLLLLEECSRQTTVLNCVRSRVSFFITYCPYSTTLRNPASIQNLLNLSCCDSFSIRSPSCSKRKFYFAGSSLSNWPSVLIALSTIHCPIKTSRPVLSWRDSNTEKSFNRFLVGCIMYQQFTMPFALELTSAQWSRSTEYWTSALSEFQHPRFCDFVPNSLWTVCFLW